MEDSAAAVVCFMVLTSYCVVCGLW